MKLFVCYGTFRFAPRPGGHPCGAAYHALVDAGHRPDVTRSYGFGMMPDVFNQTPGRKEVKRLTGNNWVPVLVTDSGEAIQGSEKIVEWARSHPAGSATAVSGAGAAGAGAGAAGAAGASEAATVSAAGAMSGGPDTSAPGVPAGEAPADGEAGDAAGEAAGATAGDAGGATAGEGAPPHPPDPGEEPRPADS